MDRCIAHPEREAAAACAACGRPCCEECLEPGHDPPRCLDCAILGTAAETTSATPAKPAARAAEPAPPRRIPVVLGVLGVLVVVAAVVLLVQRRTVGGPPPPVPAEAAATGDLMLVEEVVAELLEESGRLPDSETLAAALPEDLAAQARAGALTVEPTEGGFLVRWRTGGRELVLRSAGGESEVVEGSGP